MLKNLQKIEKYLYIVSPLLVLASLFYFYITGKFELFSIVAMVAGVAIGLLFFLRFYDDIVKKIEKELTYPGQIKVTVIRETRVSDFAK